MKYPPISVTIQAITGITIPTMAIHFHAFLSTTTITHKTNAMIINGIQRIAPIMVRVNNQPTIAQTIEAIASQFDGAGTVCGVGCTGVFSVMRILSIINITNLFSSLFLSQFLHHRHS
jgi:hypothetical protein